MCRVPIQYRPLVSICCLSFNHSKFLESTIKGFLLQKTDFPIEILIHDDASTDGSVEIIKKYSEMYPNLIVPIFQETNQFSKDCRIITNFLIPKAKGLYIALCEGDDYWIDPNKLQKSIEFLSVSPDYIACCHDVIVIDENEEILQETPYGYYKGDLLTIEDQIKYNNIPTLSIVFKNVWGDKFAKIWGGISEGCKYIMDYPLKVLLLSKGKIKYFPEKMGVYRWQRRGGHSFSSQSSLIGLSDTYCFCIGLMKYLRRNFYVKHIKYLCGKVAGAILLHQLKKMNVKQFFGWVLKLFHDKCLLLCCLCLFTKLIRMSCKHFISSFNRRG